MEEEFQTQSRKQGLEPAQAAKSRKCGYAAPRQEGWLYSGKAWLCKRRIGGSKNRHRWLRKWRQVALRERNIQPGAGFIDAGSGVEKIPTPRLGKICCKTGEKGLAQNRYLDVGIWT